MKWNSLIKDFRERVAGFSQSQPSSTFNSPTNSASPSSFQGRDNSNDDYDLALQDLSASSPPRFYNFTHNLFLIFFGVGCFYFDFVFVSYFTSLKSRSSVS